MENTPITQVRAITRANASSSLLEILRWWNQRMESLDFINVDTRSVCTWAGLSGGEAFNHVSLSLCKFSCAAKQHALPAPPQFLRLAHMVFSPDPAQVAGAT